MSKRIKEIASFIMPYKSVADIGTDHGYLLLEAFNLGINFAQAIDNKVGPLNSAKNNLKHYNHKIEFSLSDGLEDLNPKIDVVVLSGMGGSLIASILSKNIGKLKNVKRIIIQPNRNIDKVREFAIEANYKITQEKIIEEEAIYYEIIVLEKGSAKYTKAEITFGPYLLKEKNELFIKKWTDYYMHLKSLNLDENLEIIKLIESHII